MKQIKKIAWGTSKLLEMHCERFGSEEFAYCIDDFCERQNFMGLQVKPSHTLKDEKVASFQITIFAVSNHSLQAIFLKLNSFGLRYGNDFVLYSDFFYSAFVAQAEQSLGFQFNPNLYKHAVSSNMNSRVGVQTTMMGTWTLLELLNKLSPLQGAIAEVGAFECGNALICLNFLSHLPTKKYYIFDSFEGFAEVGPHDPKTSKKGDLKITNTFQEVLDSLKIFPEAIVIKGNVPHTFSEIPAAEKFALVFYDCDLYQPALDTFHYFWDKIVPGGYLVIHDHETQKNGYTGVKKATDEFFAGMKVKKITFYQNTMAVIKKEF